VVERPRVAPAASREHGYGGGTAAPVCYVRAKSRYRVIRCHSRPAAKNDREFSAPLHPPPRLHTAPPPPTPSEAPLAVGK
jgi:hypothetical protein